MSNSYLEITEVPYTHMSLEIELLKNEISNLDDDALLDECFSNKFSLRDKGVSKISNIFLSKGKIDKKQRKYLENFYILIHTELMWGTDGSLLHFGRQ